MIEKWQSSPKKSPSFLASTGWQTSSIRDMGGKVASLAGNHICGVSRDLRSRQRVQLGAPRQILINIRGNLCSIFYCLAGNNFCLPGCIP